MRVRATVQACVRASEHLYWSTCSVVCTCVLHSRMQTNTHACRRPAGRALSTVLSRLLGLAARGTHIRGERPLRLTSGRALSHESNPRFCQPMPLSVTGAGLRLQQIHPETEPLNPKLNQTLNVQDSRCNKFIRPFYHDVYPPAI